MLFIYSIFEVQKSAMNKKVYFDNAATTPIRDEVIHRMTDVMKSNFGNASSSHSYGRSSKSLIESSRKTIAALLNCSASEIVFTSGGTEAVETALKICRKWAYEVKGIENKQAQIIVCENNFHGRTTTIISFSNDPVARKHFGLLTDRFIKIEYNNLDELEAT